MHDYKESPDPSVQLTQSRVVAGILARYVYEHSEALVDRYGDWDNVVVVPSTKHPYPSALARALASDYSDVISPIDWLTLGAGSMGFNQASESGFVPAPDIEGSSVLLVDDTFTTGARIHSAAHALQSAGAQVIAGLVVARKINPDPKYFTDEVWDRQSVIPFVFTDPPWWSTNLSEI
jgi:predicted amidophosphoribosyltransferase